MSRRTPLTPEQELATLLRHDGYPEPEREHRFHPERKWRFDFAWPDWGLAVEVEGGVFRQGRHTRGRGYTEDCEKYNEAAIRGWTVIRVTPQHVTYGQALDWIARALDEKRADG